jgi:hypothetical protein
MRAPLLYNNPSWCTRSDARSSPGPAAQVDAHHACTTAQDTKKDKKLPSQVYVCVMSPRVIRARHLCRNISDFENILNAPPVIICLTRNNGLTHSYGYIALKKIHHSDWKPYTYSEIYCDLAQFHVLFDPIVSGQCLLQQTFA